MNSTIASVLVGAFIGVSGIMLFNKPYFLKNWKWWVYAISLNVLWSFIGGMIYK